MHFANFKNISAQAEISEDSLQLWLIEQISLRTGFAPGQIDITEPFSVYGIDSIAAAALSGELANLIGEEIPPTITWDYPTVELLASHLALRFSEQCAMTV